MTPGALTGFVTQFGESFVGEGANAAHINTVLGSKGGPVETAWASALAHPTQGHTPFVVALQPGLAVKPFTLFVNKATIAGTRHAELTWGAAQAGVAKGVTDAVAEDVIATPAAEELLVIAAVWVDPNAADAQLVFANNARATFAALQAGSRRLPCLEDVLAARHAPFNAFFRAPTGSQDLRSASIRRDRSPLGRYKLLSVRQPPSHLILLSRTRHRAPR